MWDDFFDMAFNPKKVDYEQLVIRVLPRLIIAFDAYYAELGDREFVYMDFDAARAAGLGDTRHGIYRVYPVSYFDNVLCQRAFGISAGDVVTRLTGCAERAELVNGGAYVIGSSKPLELEEADKLCWAMKDCITGK